MPVSTKKEVRFWDKFASKYARTPVPDGDIYEHKLALSQEHLRPDMDVLELGCGTGSTALAHAAHVRHILATDFSPNMIAIAEEKRRGEGIENVTFRTASLEDFDAEGATFDAVFVLNLIHLLENPVSALTRIHSLLKPGGVFIQSTPCLMDDMPLLRFALPIVKPFVGLPHVNFFSEPELNSWMEEAGFCTVHHWKPGKGKAVFMVAEKRPLTD